MSILSGEETPFGVSLCIETSYLVGNTVLKTGPS